MKENQKSSKYSVRVIEPDEAYMWDELIDRSSNGTLFHKFGWMKAAEKQSNTKFYPLVCEKAGEGIISLFPVFLARKFFFKILFSPPPGCAIPELGPVFILNSSKQNRIEADCIHSVEAYDVQINGTIKPDYIYILSNLKDARFFKWAQYSIQPQYTYRLDLNENLDCIYDSMDTRIRNKIKQINKNGKIELREGNVEDIHFIIGEIKSRYKEMGRNFKLNEDYLTTLHQHYGENGLRIYKQYLNDEIFTRNIVIEFKDNIKFWLGGTKNKNVPTGMNEIFHWNIIEDAHDKGFVYYEHIGANTKHLCDHKSRYGFKPEVYYKIEKWTSKGKVFQLIYNSLKKDKIKIVK